MLAAYRNVLVWALRLSAAAVLALGIYSASTTLSMLERGSATLISADDPEFPGRFELILSSVLPMVVGAVLFLALAEILALLLRKTSI